jgi:hypothetical protein
MKIAPPVQRTILIIALLVCAAAAQSLWANSLRISYARADFVLITALLCSQFCSGAEAAAVGFGAGLLSASIASPAGGGFGSLVVSRTLVCFGVGWLEERLFRDNAVIAIALVSGGTVLAESLFFAFDPHFPAASWARGVGFEVAYNVCLTLPIYLLVRVSIRTRNRLTAGPIS